MSEIYYKIRRKSDGLFSAGGSDAKFTKGGKVWKTKGHLKLHLNMWVARGCRVFHYWHNVIPTEKDRFEIVEYEVTEKNAFDIEDLK